MYLFVLFTSTHTVNKHLSAVLNSEKMRTVTFPLWIFLLKVLGIDAQLTLESVYEKVNHLEVEVAALKVRSKETLARYP